MKKALIAAAVGGLFSGSAIAQVTVYGTIDASFAQIKTGSTSVTAQGQGDYFGSSVLGFSGSEDLGGGLKASFQLEGDLNVANGTGDGGENSNTTATTNATGGLTFDRQSWVGISGAFGQVRVGRIADFADATYNGYGQAGVNLFDQDSSLGSKFPNSIEYSTKVMGLDLVTSYSNDTAAVAAGTGQAASSSLVGVGGSVQGINYRVSYIEQGASSEMMVALKTMVAGAEVGVLINSADRAAGLRTSNSSVGVIYPIAKDTNLRANYLVYNNNTTATSKYNFAGVFVDKNFSKRTAIFAGYGKKDVNNGTTSDVTTTTIGVQHKF